MLRPGCLRSRTNDEPQPRLDGAERHLQPLGDLGMAEAGEESQPEHLDAAPRGSSATAARSRASRSASATWRSAEPGGLGPEQRVLRVRLWPALAAVHVDAAVARDRVDPGRGTSLRRIEARRLSPDSDHHLLRHLLGRVRRRAGTHEERLDAARIAAKELGEGGTVGGPGDGCKQRLVGRIAVSAASCLGSHDGYHASRIRSSGLRLLGRAAPGRIAAADWKSRRESTVWCSRAPGQHLSGGREAAHKPRRGW